MPYRLLAGLAVALHVGFVVFVIFGGLALYRWSWVVWLHEAERRLDDLESGNVSAVPADRVFEKARSTLR